MNAPNSRCIQIFELVRDIPYRIPQNVSECDNTCHGKSALLHKLLDSYGFTSRIRVCSFNWSNLPLPPQIKSLIKTDSAFHSFVEVNLDGKWIILDPSFDLSLSKKLPVNKWDGISNTQLSVIPSKIFSPEESKKIVLDLRTPANLELDISSNIDLYKSLNDLYSKIRNL